MSTTSSSPNLSRAQVLECLDTLAAHTQHELDEAERIALTIAAIADQAAARLQELAGLRAQVLAASAIADDARHSPIRRHRPLNRVVQLA